MFEKIKSKKGILGLIIIITWVLILSGILRIPDSIWLILVIISIISYLAISGRSFRRDRSLDSVIKDMDEYMERKAEEQFSEDEEKEFEEEYNFEDDIKIIKK